MLFEVIVMYSMREMATLIGKTEQTIYRLGRENKEFKNLLETASEKTARGKIYDKSVLLWLLNNYKMELPTEESLGRAFQARENAPVPVSIPQSEEIHAEKINALQGEIERLKQDNENLRALLAAAEARERERNEQLSQALLCLQQEQRAQQLLLSDGRPSLWEKMKRAFKKKDD